MALDALGDAIVSYALQADEAYGREAGGWAEKVNALEEEVKVERAARERIRLTRAEKDEQEALHRLSLAMREADSLHADFDKKITPALYKKFGIRWDRRPAPENGGGARGVTLDPKAIRSGGRNRPEVQRKAKG